MPIHTEEYSSYLQDMTTGYGGDEYQRKFDC